MAEEILSNGEIVQHPESTSGIKRSRAAARIKDYTPPVTVRVEDTVFDDRLRRFQLMNGKGRSVDEVLGEELPMVQWSVKVGRGLDPKTGTPTEFPVTSILLSDGRVYSCASDVVAEQFLDLERAMGGTIFDRPVAIRITKIRSRLGVGTYTNLEILGVCSSEADEVDSQGDPKKTKRAK